MLYNNYDYQTDNLDIIAIGKIFKKHFRFIENRELLEKLPKPKDISEIYELFNQQEWLTKNQEYIDIIKKALSYTNPDFRFNKTLTKTSKAQILNYDDYINIKNSVESFCFLLKKGKVPFLEGNDFQKIQSSFKYFNRHCELLFDFKSNALITYKHPDLKEIDKKITELHKEIRSQLGQISSRWASNELLQQNNYDIYDEKFVLPVRSDRFSSSLGRIIHRSKGGGTLYVEPFQLKELSNQIEETKAKLEREIYKILKTMSDELYSQQKNLKLIFNSLVSIDHLFGRYQCALTYKLSRPEFNNNKTFKIFGLFHPLIENPITNDLNIRQKGMLISGPNTGGKTVLLKSLCLCLILPHHGIYIPASNADIHFSQEIYFMSHDNQSLKDGLSSFSSEAMMYIQSMGEVSSEAVIFIDEIFNTTSSYEASLLGCALIRFINNIGATTFISSHHETLKEKVFHDSLLESGHMGFKKGSSEPTYVLHQGSPGRSFAREVFIRIEKQLRDDSLISQWLQDEKGYQIDLDKVIETADDIKERAKNQLEKNLALEKELLTQRKNIENLLQIERDKMIQDFESRWKKIKQETLDLTEKIKRGEVKNIVKVTDSLNQMVKKSSHPDEKSKDITPFDSVPTEGDTVTILKLGIQGKVLQTKGKKAYVESGKIKSWVPFWDLGKGHHRKQPDQKSERVKINVLKDISNRNMKLDARGMRREVFIKEAEDHILDVINGDIPFVDIIHGHGDGVLKKALQSILKRHRDDVQADHLEGNMGTTRIELKTNL